MICSFCGSPAAHPSTGCQYGARTLACAACVRSFWAWLVAHTNKRARRGHGPATARTFYESIKPEQPRQGGRKIEPS